MKYLVKAIWYKKSSGSCRSYIGKKATPIILEFENIEEATKRADELKLNTHPYRQYANIEVVEV